MTSYHDKETTVEEKYHRTHGGDRSDIVLHTTPERESNERENVIKWKVVGRQDERQDSKERGRQKGRDR